MTNNLVVSEWIIARLIQLGATQFVISPGSRSTPLTVAAARNSQAETTVHFDERGAAYFALGHGKATGHPAVLICTSGTAVANYFPAVVEASMDNVPMIILSADRPPELIGVGANQAIFQENMYGDYPRYFMNMGPPEADTSLDAILAEVDQLYSEALGSRPGPVHLNCQFREPLLPTSDIVMNDSASMGLENASTNPKLTQPTKPANIAKKPLSLVLAKLENYGKGLIIIGRSTHENEDLAILSLAKTLNWPIFPDVQSSLRFKPNSNVINYFDLMLLQEPLKSQKPEIVLHFGGPYTSKRLLTYLNDPDIFYISVKPTPEKIDPNHQVKMSVQTDIIGFCQSITDLKLNKPEHWLQTWRTANDAILGSIHSQLNSLDQISEPVISYEISKLTPNSHTLMLANSMAVREMEMFAAVGHFAGKITANRGSSGIDGLFASAAGFQVGSSRPLTLLIGDLASLHDLNSLSLIKNSPLPIIIVLINNKGGGIFNFLPVSQETDVFESYFGTPHDYSFEKAAEMFGIGYENPRSLNNFRQAYSQATEGTDSIMIEVNTDRYENHRTHQELFDIIRES